MKRVTVILALLAAPCALAQDAKPGDLVPVEPGTSDTSAMGTTLRVMPVELNETTNFGRLYGVVGRPDLLVRSHGGMYGVFEQGQYVGWKGRVFAVWPSGTQFYIGRPDFSRMRASPMRMATDAGMQPAPGVRVRTPVPDQAPPATGPSLRVDRRPDALPDARVPDARVPDARIGSAPLRPGQATAPPAGTREESHAVPPDSRRIDPPADATPASPQPASGASEAPAASPAPAAAPSPAGAP